MKPNMFRATHRPSSGAQNCTSSLWFWIREKLLDFEVVGHWQRPATSTSNNFSRKQNQRLLVQFELLMMSGVSPETCWISYKHWIINFDTLLHLVGYFCMNKVLRSRLSSYLWNSYSSWSFKLTTHLNLVLTVRMHELYLLFLLLLHEIVLCLVNP